MEKSAKNSNFQNGKIYKIVNKDESMVYIGSTTQPLSKRFSQHRTDYKRWKSGEAKKSTTSFEIFENCGVENARILLIEKYPCKDKSELAKREGEITLKTHCVNKVIAGRTKKEYYKANKEQILEKLYEKNKDKCKECTMDVNEYFKSVGINYELDYNKKMLKSFNDEWDMANKCCDEEYYEEF